MVLEIITLIEHRHCVDNSIYFKYFKEIQELKNNNYNLTLLKMSLTIENNYVV